MLVTPTAANTYWHNYPAGQRLFELGVVPLWNALNLSAVATYAREPELRKMARQAVAHWHLGELIGERRGAVG